MPQREPARRQTAGEPPGAKVKMRLDETGRWVPVEAVTDEAMPISEAPERPPTGDDPRNPLAGPE
jgi:hypothetical protein